MRDYTVLQQNNWLEPLLPLFGQPGEDNNILELGCGPGDDTHFLTTRGYRMMATDRSKPRLALCAVKAPGASRKQVDLEEPLPFGNASFNHVLASLCLHYFAEQKTVEIVTEIWRCLKADGVLFGRFNSTNDINHGAVGHPVISPDYYMVKGYPKRFFDAPSLEKLFSNGWQIEQVEEKTINRYQTPKVVWQLIARKI